MPNGFAWRPNNKSLDMYLTWLVISDIQSLRGTLASYAEVDPPANTDAPKNVDDWLGNDKFVPAIHADVGDEVWAKGRNRRCDERTGRPPGSASVTFSATSSP